MRKIFSLLFLMNLSLAWGQDPCGSEYTLNGPGGNWACAGTEHTYSVSGPAGVSFSASWDFGDGTPTVSGTSVKHTYQNYSFDNYGVVVTITSGGNTCNKFISIGTFCLDIPPLPEDTTPPGNPFKTGEEGNWRVKRTWVLQMERLQTRNGANDNLNLRTDGTYKKFYTFWNPATASEAHWAKHNDDKWTFKTQINHYNPFGSFELENVDPLNRFSAAIYGYNYTLPVAVASNSRYREIAFDSFEDYDFGRCANNHFSFQFVEGIENKIKETTSHSGRRSIRLASGESLTLEKKFAECADEETPQDDPR